MSARQGLTLHLEDLHLAQPEVVGLLPVVPDVDELPGQANGGGVSAAAANEGRPSLREGAVKLGARLVQGLVALDELCRTEKKETSKEIKKNTSFSASE